MKKKSKNRKSIKRSSGNKSTLAVLIIMLVIALTFYLFDNFSGIFHKPIIHYGNIKDVGLPKIEDSTYYIENRVGRFSYYYSPENKQALWVAYVLTKNDLQGKSLPRSDRFNADDSVTENLWVSPTKSDYYKTSFDRGHLVPSADRNKSKAENIETFLFSNIAPQKANLNRNVWRILEQQIRDWAEMYDTLYVVTGGVFDDRNMGYIGETEIVIPHSFYKVVLSVSDNQYNAIGFIMENSSKVKSDYMQYSVSVDEVEKITGLDLYPNLPLEVEKDVERRFNKIFWKETQEKYTIYD